MSRAETSAPSVAAKPARSGGPAWVELTAHRPPEDSVVVRPRRVVLQLLASAAVVVVLVALVGSWASQRLAEREAVNDAAVTADLLAESVVQPALTDALVTGSPEAIAAMDKAVREHVLGDASVRVKIWTAKGKIVYSDEPRLIGQVFELGEDERSVLDNPTIRAEVSDLDEPENRYELSSGPLLEVYRPVWTPGKDTLLFETYASYDQVSTRAGQLWRGFAGVTLSSLLLLLLLLTPLLWRLMNRLSAAQATRERLLQRAVDASTDERRRIAGTLHDGVVQDLAATSFAVSGAAQNAVAVGQDRLAAGLEGAAATVRTSIAGLRSLLVDIYPPSLATAGLPDALQNLAAALRTREMEVSVTLPADGQTGLSEEGDRLVFRVAQECLRNAMSHSQARKVTVALDRDGGACLLTITDDGVGFDLDRALTQPADGHFGLQVLRDVVQDAGGELSVATAPGAGTAWRLRVPFT